MPGVRPPLENVNYSIGPSYEMQRILEEITKWTGPTSRDDGYDFCDRVCRAYRDADSDTREELREAVACNERVSGWLLYDTISEVGPGGFLVEAAKRATETGDYQSYLRAPSRSASPRRWRHG